MLLMKRGINSIQVNYKKRLITSILVLAAIFLSADCGKTGNESETTGTGTIVFTANGEDFVRKGFIDKNGWHISFTNVFVNIVNPTAYMPGNVSLKAVLKDSHLVDLAKGDKNAQPVVLGKLENRKAGNYQALKFKLRRIESGKYKGYSIVIIGTAEKAGKKTGFTIKLNEEMDYDGREGYVGDQMKGMLSGNGSTEVEMTFHFDHIFGDNEAPSNDHINTDSVGFDFFNQFAKGGGVDAAQTDMKSKTDYATLVKAMWTLGHLGEGHCQVSNQSSREIQ